MVSTRTKTLIAILLIAVSLRIGPVFLFDGMPIGYDNPYHVRMSEIIQDSGAVPGQDPILGGRPYTYPAFYHILLASLSIVSGLPVQTLIPFLLPFISFLVVPAIYIFARQFSGETWALVVALMAACASALTMASYNSPENAAFLLLPLSIMLLARGRLFLGSLLFSLCLFWNYFAFLISLPAMLLAFAWRREVLPNFLFALLASALVWLLSYGPDALLWFSVSSGTSFVANNLKDVMLSLVLDSGLILLVFLAYAAKKLTTPAAKYWYLYALTSGIALVSYLITPVMRSWEQPKFLSLGIACLTASIVAGKYFKKFVYAVIIIFFFASLLSAFQIAYPKTNSLDLHAISWLESKNPEGNILADPTLSEEIANRTSLAPQIMTALQFETLTENNFVESSLKYLGNQPLEDEQAYVRESGLQYILLNFEDEKVRGTSHLDEKPYLNKVYSLNYYQPCPFGLLPVTQGFACGNLETKILKAKTEFLN